MADRYWVGGAGNWNSTTKWSTSSGGSSGASVPTSADNVIFDDNSGAGNFTATVNAASSCANFTCSTAVIKITIAASGIQSLSVYGSWSNTSSSYFAFNLSSSGSDLYFSSTSTGKTILTNGVTLSAATIYFNGVGGGWTLSDAFTSNTIILQNGTLNTNGYSLTCISFLIRSGTKTLTLGSSTVTLSGSWDVQDGTNFTLNANTSTINSTNTTTGSFNGGGFTYYNVSLYSSQISNFKYMSGVNTFNNLTVNADFTDGGAVRVLGLIDNITVNGTLTVSGAAANQRNCIRSYALGSANRQVGGTARTITAATLASTSDVDFQDITAAGASAPWSGTRIGDCGGNTNITTTASKTVYWNLSGTQDFWANGWATTSGGTPATNNYPLPQDTAVFDNTGSIGTVNFGASSTSGTTNLPNIDASGRTSSATFSGGSLASANIYGDYKIGTGLTVSGFNIILYYMKNGTQYILSSGITNSTGMRIFCTKTTVKLSSAITLSNYLYLFAGTFDANGYSPTIAYFDSTITNFTRTITMGSADWVINGSTGWYVSSTNLTLNKNTANISLSVTGTSAITFYSVSNLSYNKLTIAGSSTGNVNFSGSSTFTEFASTRAVAYSIRFTAGTTQTIGTWSVSGSSGKLVTVTSQSSASHTLTKTGGGTVSADYLSISYSTATPASTWYAGTNSTNGGNNSGWIFTAPPPPTYGGMFMLFK